MPSSIPRNLGLSIIRSCCQNVFFPIFISFAAICPRFVDAHTIAEDETELSIFWLKGVKMGLNGAKKRLARG
jgi:hypothetical protein